MAKEIFFADFETTTSKISMEKSHVWLWGIKSSKKKKLQYDVNIESFIEYTIKNKTTPIYFHNVSFDGNYIFKYLLKDGIEFVDTKDLKDNQWTWLCDDRGNIYSMKYKIDGFEVTLFDSWKVLMSSIENIGDSMGYEKLEIDYDAYNIYNHKRDVTKEALEYLERDIDIAMKAFKKATKIYEKKLTRAGMSMYDFKQLYGDREFSRDFGGNIWNFRLKCFEYQNVLSQNEWDIVAMSYQGGYTNWNKKYTNKVIKCKNGISADLNSSYSASMLNKMPYGRPMYSKPNEEHVVLRVIFINYAKLKNKKYPALIKDRKGKYKDAKYLDEVKYEERVYWDEELEYIKKYYDMDYRIVRTMYFKTKYVFNEWINLKQHYKINAKDNVERNFHKGILNSLYGKFGQNYKIGKRIIYRDGFYVKKVDGVRWLIDVKTNLPDKKVKNRTRYGRDGEFTHKADYDISEDLKYMPIASYIAMKSRMLLFPAILDNLDQWIYSDTDSCYYKDIVYNLDIHDSEFGKWKWEHKFNKFKVLRAKTYMFQATAEYKKGKWVESDKVVKKIASVSKIGKAKIDWDNFHLGSVIKDGKRGLINVDGGKLIIDRDFTFKDGSK